MLFINNIQLQIKSAVFFSLMLIVFMTGNLVWASDNPEQTGEESEDILEQIGQELGKPEIKPGEKRESYLGSLFSAMTDKDSYILYKELYLSGRYSSELEQMEGRNSLGFILFGTFSGPDGQLGDLNVQFRAAYYTDQFERGIEMGREYTEGIDDFELELHNAYLRLRALPPLLTVRAGRFYVPYGLQPWIDTHGTLLQAPIMGVVGMERDWGVAIEGQNDTLEYQLGLTRGSGMEFFQRDNNYILAGKVSTPRIGEHLNDWVGGSFLLGNIFDPAGVGKLRSFDMAEKESRFADEIVRKWRIGMDGQIIVGPMRLRAEVSTGQDEGREEILAEFAEVKYSFGNDNRWAANLQFENLTQNINSAGSDSDTTLRGGLIYNFSANYNLQLVVSRDLNVIFGREDTWIGLLFYGQKGGGWLDW